MMLVAVMCAAFAGQAWGQDPIVLFHETFGNNTTSARAWIDTYSVKTGVSPVYSGASYTVTNAKQSKNTMGYGSTSSALVSGQGTVGSFIVGPLDASSYSSLAVSNYFGMSSSTWNSTYSYMKLSYSTDGSSYTEVLRSGSNPSGAVSNNNNLVQASYTLPGAAQSSTLYLKFEFYCYQLNKKSQEIGQAYFDEVELTGVAGSDPSSDAAFATPAPSLDLRSGNTYSQVATTAVGYTGSVTYSLSANTAGATIDGSTVTVSQAGSVTVTANAAADPGNYSASSASYTLTVTDTRETTSISIDDGGITNTNVYAGTAAGSLSASVTYGSESPVPEASVTWSGDNDEVATINSTTGAVTLVGAGSVTFTANYTGVGVYKSSSQTYNMTVTNVNPNLLTIWSEDFSGYAANAVPSGGTYSYACVDGGSDTKIYDAALAGGTSPELLVGKSGGSFKATVPLDKFDGNLILSYKTNLKSMTISTTTEGISGGATFSSAGTHEVTFTGITAATTSITIVFTPGSENVRLDDIELKGLMAAPQFSVPAGGVTAGTSVTLSATEGATIYYTTNETTPTSSSTVYTSAISIDEDVTIKAIAIKDGKSSSVGSATYTIESDPFISLSTTSVDATVVETDGSITVTYNNLTNYTAEIKWLEADGTTPATYDWLDAEINGSTKNVDYLIEANDTYSSRTAYLKVYASGDEGKVLSDLITITQAGKTIDYTTLPFVWDGGSSEDLTASTGVTAYGLGSDYGPTHNPYNVKMDNTDDYIQFKTNEQPVKVLIGVKMVGGDNTSTLTVQESADGSSFTDVEVLTISGDQNDILNLKTTSSFASSTRYVRLLFTKGSNVGVGPIMITNFEGLSVTLNGSGYATFASTYALDFTDDSEYSAWQVTAANSGTGVLTFSQITGKVAPGTGVLLKGTPSASINIPVAASGSDISETNKLVGITAATAVAADTYYGLSGDTFKKVNAGTVPAGKALLPASEVAGVKAFTFVFEDETTGISTVANGQEPMANGQIFNLAGQRMSKLQKGVNIVNGKKVLVK